MNIEFESVAQWRAAEDQGVERGHVHRAGVSLGAVVVKAEANHGRWVGMCPLCPSARMVCLGIDFWCPHCGCADIGGIGIRVDWPTEAEMVLADDLLGVRPVTARNWRRSGWVPGRADVWGERLVEDIAVENLERGLPVPGRIRAAVDAFVEADWSARGLAHEMQGWVSV